MPTHVHAIVFDREFDAERLSRTLDGMRKFTGRRIADHCDAHMPSAFSSTLRASAGEDRERRVWQSGTHPVGILTERFWRQKFEYIHLNPVRRGSSRFQKLEIVRLVLDGSEYLERRATC